MGRWQNSAPQMKCAHVMLGQQPGGTLPSKDGSSPPLLEMQATAGIAEPHFFPSSIALELKDGIECFLTEEFFSAFLCVPW